MQAYSKNLTHAHLLAISRHVTISCPHNIITSVPTQAHTKTAAAGGGGEGRRGDGAKGIVK